MAAARSIDEKADLVSGIHHLVAAVAGVDPGCRDRATLTAAVASTARVRAWLDGREVQDLAAQLAKVAAFPEQDMAGAARTSLREAGRVLERARTVERIPPLGEALTEGRVRGAHVDVVGQALRQLRTWAAPCPCGPGRRAGRGGVSVDAGRVATSRGR